jgi:hypothetical protein
LDPAAADMVILNTQGRASLVSRVQRRWTKERRLTTLRTEVLGDGSAPDWTPDHLEFIAVRKESMEASIKE